MKIPQSGALGRVALLAALLLAAVAIAVPAQAQGNDDEAAVEGVINQIVVDFNAGDVDAFTSHFTDEGLVAFVDDPSVTTPEMARAALTGFIGTIDVSIVEISQIEIDGDTATADVQLSLGGQPEHERFGLIRSGDTWLINDYEVVAEPPPAGSLVIRAGDGETGYSVNEFLPEDITVQTGTTVTWLFPWYEIHTVTTLPIAGDPSMPTHPGATGPIPYTGSEFISSGIIAGDPEAPPQFSITFNSPGEFQYICIIHPDMVGSVTVVDEGDVDTQEELDARSDDLYDTYIGELKQLHQQLEAAYPKVTDNGDGTQTHELYTGGVTEHGDVMQFQPDAVTINAYDTVRWINDTETPHTVTFNPDQFDPSTIPPGPEGILEVPVTVPDDGSFDGASEGFIHSGTLGAVPDWNGGTSFELTFGTPGMYQYICILHADQGMVGAVNVQEVETPTPTATATATATATPTQTATPTPTRVVPQPPDTGTGSAGGSGSGVDGIALGLGLLALVAGGAIVARRAMSR